MGKRGAWLTGAGVMAVVVAARSFFVVDESELALVVSFGSVVRSVSAAGLHGKRPWHSVQRFDGRMQLLELEPRETLTRDPKNIVVAPYACWRVDPAQLETFVRAVPGGDPTTAGRRLGERIWDVLMAELSALRLTQIVNENPESLEQSQMLRRVLVTCQAKASDLGIELRDVQLKRITRPEGTKQAVYREMIAERAKEANYIRREGERRAVEVRAAAREEADKILAAAEGRAQVIRGQGEAEATRTYGQAHRQDPEFFLLLRLLETYRKIIDDKTTLVLSGDSDLFRLLTVGRLDSLPELTVERPSFAASQPAGDAEERPGGE